MPRRPAMEEYSARFSPGMKERLARAAAILTEREGSPVHVATLIRRATTQWIEEFERGEQQR